MKMPVTLNLSKWTGLRDTYPFNAVFDPFIPQDRLAQTDSTVLFVN